MRPTLPRENSYKYKTNCIWLSFFRLSVLLFLFVFLFDILPWLKTKQKKPRPPTPLLQSRTSTNAGWLISPVAMEHACPHCQLHRTLFILICLWLSIVNELNFCFCLNLQQNHFELWFISWASFLSDMADLLLSLKLVLH